MCVDTQPTIPSNVEGQCPRNWISWGEDCYAFPSSLTDTVTSWDNGTARCIQLAGNDDFRVTLASVHSDVENKFIYDSFVSRGLTYNQNTPSAVLGFYEATGKAALVN